MFVVFFNKNENYKISEEQEKYIDDFLTNTNSNYVYSNKIVILVISSSKKYNNELNNRWNLEKNIWLKSINKKKYNNIDVFFLETNENLKKNTVTIENNTVYCGIKDSYIPGIFHKTLLALKYLNNYDFYVRTNLSTIVNYKALNEYLKNIPNSFFSTGFACETNFYQNFLSSHDMEEKNKIVSKINQVKLPYYGDTTNNDNKWFLGWAIIFSKKYAELLVKYTDNIPYILEAYLGDDVLLGILIGKHDNDIDKHCKIICSLDKYTFEDINEIIFIRTKKVFDRNILKKILCYVNNRLE
jgi:hypothetical protein